MFGSAISDLKTCIFCHLPNERILEANEFGFIIRDAYPISPGHTLVIPRRHLGSFFDLEISEKNGLLDLLDYAKKALDSELSPQGYNVGINDGAVAGQTIPHLHIHLIPRFKGDQKDARGGVRWIFPDKADYWSERA
jgi:diadenosine tetraphosphate (Ap4A) HIT family hydrolase